MGRLADTRASTLHDVPLHAPSSQREDIHYVNVDVQVTAPSLGPELPDQVIWSATRLFYI
jgi:hypothetical protein